MIIKYQLALKRGGGFYPARASRQGVTHSDVDVLFSLSNGGVIEISSVKSSNPVFEDAALSAVRPLHCDGQLAIPDQLRAGRLIHRPITRNALNKRRILGLAFVRCKMHCPEYRAAPAATVLLMFTGEGSRCTWD